MINVASLEIKIIDILKTNKLTVPIYKKLKTAQNNKRFKVDSINTFIPYANDSKKTRYNLIIPSLRKTRVFAGISSALTFFLKLTSDTAECRIIVIGDEEYSSNTTYQVNGYEHSPAASKQLIFASDCKKLDVRINDFFVMTSWKTAISFMPVLKWQKNHYSLLIRQAIYLIQDYEPGFFPWSSEYVLAESTYSNSPEDIIAVFNSQQLYSYFKNKGYTFGAAYYFRPMLNSALKDILLQEVNRKHAKRKRRILIYGRPSEQRNAFEIIRYSLELWSNEYDQAKDWEIISLGEGFDNIELKNNVIKSHGKVSLDEYAQFMLSAYAGISLMVSPHPSYPPLEMSTFGVRTITNKFEGKDLTSFNDNIVSISNCSPNLIVRSLSRLCDEYEEYKAHLIMDKDYLEGNSLELVVTEVKKKIKGFVIK